MAISYTDEQVDAMEDKITSLRAKEDHLKTTLKSVRETMTDWLVESYGQNDWPETSDGMRDAFASLGLEVPTESRSQKYRVEVSVECPVWADDDDVAAEFEDAEGELNGCEGVTYVEVTW